MRVKQLKIKTKFGTVSISDKGYYRVSSIKEGNFGKYLHRLIFEDYYKICLLDEVIVHHKDGDKLNNNINNLEIMLREDHISLHHAGKYISEETRQKISESNKGYAPSLESNIKISARLTKDFDSTYFRVSKRIDKKMKQGFTYRYQYYEGGKRHSISAKSIEKLKAKIIKRGLIWKKINVECEV